VCATRGIGYYLQPYKAAMSHPHEHVPGSNCCGDHTVPGDEEGSSLLPAIDTLHIECLNEKRSATGRTVFKTLANKQDQTSFVESPGGDPTLIFRIPFTSAVRIKSVCIGSASGRAPTTMKLFVNREDMDFSNADEMEPAQTITLAEDTESEIFHPLKPARFNGVHTLHIYLFGCSHSDELCIFFVGLRGVDTKVRAVGQV
jgi:hypothetical protein